MLIPLKFLPWLPSWRAQWQELSTKVKLLVILIAGLSVSIVTAGVVLRQRRRRYRAISTTTEGAVYPSSNASGFSAGHSALPGHKRTSSFPPPVPEFQVVDFSNDEMKEGRSFNESEGDWSDKVLGKADSEVFLSLSQGNGPGELSNQLPDSDTDCGRTAHLDIYSDSEDSFHSTVEDPFNSVDSNVGGKHELYLSAFVLAEEGRIQCRKYRTRELFCSGNKDFLAKLHCVRQAFSLLVQSQGNRDYIVEVGQELMCRLLRGANRDAQEFEDAFHEILHYVEDPSNWSQTEAELRERGVKEMNIFDIALDFMLLDAFDDLSSPPSALLSVIQNNWISDSIKQSMLNTALWSIIKAKKSMLRNKNGFLSRFYRLSSTLSPMFAWGFLGTNEELKHRCLRFKAQILDFLQAIFSLERSRYSSVHALADDMMYHARQTAHALSDL